MADYLQGKGRQKISTSFLYRYCIAKQRNIDKLLIFVEVAEETENRSTDNKAQPGKGIPEKGMSRDGSSNGLCR